ncbi:uncharacterized protein LOC129588232 [Paramacrobiotus metropolitanus]|uniref:uncharacterized protein LOC129588232 n=1 Tax=Paramacrobiotus metropolitanus TaxID=2943436 RepID=UPI002445EF21|nr:uncharacterized protein LOC129588232 [Paramacrobiotus metropolitanus]
MSDRNSVDDKEVAALAKNDSTRKSDEIRKYKIRSPSQSPVTVHSAEAVFPSPEERDKFRGNTKWFSNIEAGYFAKMERAFDTESINGYGMENGIELDVSGAADEEHSSGNMHGGHLNADRAAVASEYWQEVSAKANSSNSRNANSNSISGSGGDHSASNLAQPGPLLGERPSGDASAAGMRGPESQQMLRSSFVQLSPQRYSPKLESHGSASSLSDMRQTRSPGILPYRGPSIRNSGGGRSGGVIQSGYMRNARYDDRDDLMSDFREMRIRGGDSYPTRKFQRISLGPYEELFKFPLPDNAKFFDSHAHWCFGIKKLQSQGIETYRDMRNAFPEMFPPSFAGSIQVFCLPLYLRSYDHWHRKLIEGTEGELWFTYGCHPNFVDDWNEEVKAGMSFSMQRANEIKRLVGLGEIGLDYNRQNNNEEKKQRQRDVFRTQLDMATKHNLPIVIHCRNDEGLNGNNQAELDCFDIIRERVPHNWPIHRHCFRGSFGEAQKWMDHFTNVAFGFTPCIAGNKDVLAREAVKQLPLDKILLETDAPYYTPASMSNFPMESSGDKQPRKVAIPGGIALVTADEISKIKNIPIETVANQTRENTLRLYQIDAYLFVAGNLLAEAWNITILCHPAILSEHETGSVVKMMSMLNRFLDWIRSLFWKEEMELTLVGLQNSGKTTFVNVIASGQFTEDMIPTVGFNMRKITKGNVTIKLWDIGGQPRFRSMWERYCRGVTAIVYMVDAADQEKLEASKNELHNLLEKPQLHGIPVLVLGNKKDLPGAFNEKELIDRLNLNAIQDREICCYSISCKEKQNIDITLQWLIRHSKSNRH